MTMMLQLQWVKPKSLTIRNKTVASVYDEQASLEQSINNVKTILKSLVQIRQIQFNLRKNSQKYIS